LSLIGFRSFGASPFTQASARAALEAAPAYVGAEIAGMAAWELSGPAAEDLGDIPITVITATVPPTPPPGQLGPDGIPAEARVRDAEAFWGAQRDYAKAAGGRTVEAEGVGHYVHRERPQLVIDEVRALLQRARERTR
jgi:pimeloyl-ACP methyl ester carboxylesterase